MQFNSLFYPKSIAVIGASTKEKSVGNDVVKNLVTQGFAGKIFPVNPKAQTLYGLPMYPSLDAINESIDLAVIAIPAAVVPEAIAQAADKGATAAIIISAGFKEVGNLALEESVIETCKEHNVTLIGPNCLGVINPEISMNASFAGIMPEFGNVAFASQSGALCTSVLDYAREAHLGFSKFMSIGNKACVDESTLLEYFASDPQTKVIAMYVEQLTDAPRFIDVCKRVTQGENPKPIFMLKSGRTSAGAAAIASHTGSLSGGDSAYDALFAQSGVIRANTIRELIEFLVIFSQNPLKDVHSVTIVTNAGGPGVIATDEVIKSGLKVSPLTEKTQKALQSFLPAAASTKNPVDILGDAKADRYQQTLKVISDSPETEAVLVILTPQSMTEPEETAQALVTYKQQSSIPVVASFMGQQTVASAVQILEEAKISTTAFPELAARGLGALHHFVEWSAQPASHPFTSDVSHTSKVQDVLSAAANQGLDHLSEVDSLSILSEYGLPLLQSQELFTLEDAEHAATQFTHPVALKIISPDILHKSDVGGVLLSVNPDKIPEMYQTLLERVQRNVPNAKLTGVLAVEMAPANGVELIVGGNTVEGLGKTVLVGLGGIYVEVFKDISLGFAPLSQEFSLQMIQRLSSFALLNGARGQAKFDVDAVCQSLGKISALLIDHPEIKELDINPLLVLPKGEGVRVLDARILL